MTERDDIDVLAGEYVLGTLDAAERDAAKVARRRDPALEAAIAAWEARLDPLADGIVPVAPRKSLQAQIEAQLSLAPLAPLVRLERHALRWRRAAIAATALAASLMLAIGVRGLAWRQAEGTYVAVFQKDDASPAFLLTVDLKTRVLSVRQIGRAHV